MNIEKYDAFLKDQSAIIIGTTGSCYFKDVNDIFVIQFLFTHYGMDSDNNSIIPKKRISFRVFPFEKIIPEINKIIVNGSITILVNADVYEYAFAFNLSIDSLKKIIKFELTDKPELGENFITTEESDGIIVNYEQLISETLT